jgi:hypothetical protein
MVNKKYVIERIIGIINRPWQRAVVLLSIISQKLLNTQI